MFVKHSKAHFTPILSHLSNSSYYTGTERSGWRTSLQCQGFYEQPGPDTSASGSHHSTAPTSGVLMKQVIKVTSLQNGLQHPGSRGLGPDQMVMTRGQLLSSTGGRKM